MTPKRRHLIQKVKSIHKDWDQSFVKEKIPQYTPEANSHAEGIKFRSPHSIRKRLPRKLSEGIRRIPVFREEDLTKLKEEIETLWDLKNVPEYHRLVFRDSVFTMTRSRAIPILMKEIENLKKNKSLVQGAIKTVMAREDSLKSLIEMNSYLQHSPDWDNHREVKIECAELLHAHRMLTLAAVECIVKWRDLFQLSGNTYDFIWENENYLHKIKNDTDFLVDSEFAKIFNFSKDGNDPLILLPSGRTPYKSKKRINNSFFENEGHVTIPVPAMILTRLKMAEKVIMNDNALFNALNRSGLKKKDLMNELIKGEIIDGFIKECLRKVIEESIEEFTSSKRPSLEENLYFDMIDHFLLNSIKELIHDIQENNSVSNWLFTAAKEPSIDHDLTEMIPRRISVPSRTYIEFLDRSTEDIYEKSSDIDSLSSQISTSLIDEMILKTIEEIIKENLSKKIYTHLISEIISKIVKDSVRECDYEETMHTYLSELVCASLFDSNIYRSIIDSAKQEYLQELDRQITQELYIQYLEEEIKDACESAFVVDEQILPIEKTPEVEPPITPTVDILDLNYDVERKFNDSTKILFKPLSVNESSLRLVLNDYIQYIPNQLSRCLTPFDILIHETKANNNPSWFWATVNDKIVGLLVYTENSHLQSPYTISIHHLSCINFSAYKIILSKTERFIKNTEKCEMLTIEFSAKSHEIDKEIRNLLSNFKYRLKNQDDALVYGKEMQGRKRAEQMKIETRCEIDISEEEVKETKRSGKNLILFGERICILKALKNIHDSDDEIQTLNRLQKDILDLLDIIEAIEGFDFPFIDSNNSLKISFNWIGFSEIKYQPLDIAYHYIKFHHNLTYRLCETAKIYTVPTSVPTISAFYIVAPDLLLDLKTDFRNLKTDLYYKAESLLRSADFEVKAIDELWVPAFNIEATSNIHWMEGLMTSSNYIQKCSTSLVIQSFSTDKKQGLLLSEPLNVISHNFIFGLIQKDTYKAIEGPLFACLVQEKDWIKIS